MRHLCMFSLIIMVIICIIISDLYSSLHCLVGNIVFLIGSTRTGALLSFLGPNEERMLVNCNLIIVVWLLGVFLEMTRLFQVYSAF